MKLLQIYGQIEYHEHELTTWDKCAQIVMKIDEIVAGFVALMAKYQLICNPWSADRTEIERLLQDSQRKWQLGQIETRLLQEYGAQL